MAGTFLNIPDAAKLAGYSLRHFRRLAELDGLPIVHIGRKFFILRQEFDKWKGVTLHANRGSDCSLPAVLMSAGEGKA